MNSTQKVINLGYTPSIIPNGTICVLKFQISETAVPGSEFTISMSASASKDRQPVSGGVTAPSCTVKVKEENNDAYAVKYTFAAEDPAPGDDLTVTLSVESGSTLVDGLIVYNLSFDTSLAEFNGFDSLGSLVTSSVAGATSANSNTKTINLGYSPPIVPNGEICVLKFKIKEDATPGSELTISMSASASKDRLPVNGVVIAPTCTVVIKEPEVRDTRKITISDFRNYTVSINGQEDYFTSEITENIAFDAHVVVTATDTTDFAYWRNSANVIISRTPVLDFYVTVTETYTAVYNTKAPNKVTVVFESYYNQVMGRLQVTVDGIGSMSIPEVPSRFGYTAVGWEYDRAALKELATVLLATDETLDDVIIVKPVYTKDAASATLTVNGGSGSGDYTQDTVVTIVAGHAPTGKKFSHWEESDGTVLSYRPDFTFYVMRDMEITAIFVDEGTEVIAAGVATLISIVKDYDNKKLSFVAYANVPDGFTIKNAGVIATSDPVVGNDPEAFNFDSALYVRGQADSGTATRYTWTKGNVGTETWYVRAFITYTDTNGNTLTVFGDIVNANLD